MKSRDEIEKLKKSWTYDPIWDIETTDGFEDHKPELLKYRLEKEKEWNDEYNKAIAKQCEKLGLEFPKFKKLMEHIIWLERQIEKIQEKAETE